MISRYIAHIMIKAETPLKIGSNSSDFLQDSPIQKDWNGLPMILGTSITGVLRKHYRDVYTNDDLFGFQKDKEDEGEGSKVILSNALLLEKKEDGTKEVNEGLLLHKSDFLKIFDNLPIREHTKIDHRGVTGTSKEYSKFDEEIVYKGVEFRFSIEVLEDKNAFENLLKLLQSPAFRLGGGTSKGFGKFNVLEIKTKNIETIEALKDYSNSLNNFNGSRVDLSTNNQSETHTKYILNIVPDNFFMFGSGFGDADADQTAVYEKVIDYENASLSDKEILIPASSVKGALSHRTAFYYNQSQEIYSDTLSKEEFSNYVDENNDAVKALFGHKKELAEDKKTELGQKGKILISDCFKEEREKSSKVFDHVSIDRFTGGARDGALFQEKTISDDREYSIEILLEKGIDRVSVKAFEKALDDVCSGMLALGGATTKGHGIFSGSVLKDGEVLDVNR